MAGVSNVSGLLGFFMEVDGVPQVARVLGVKADAVKDLRPVWDDIADDFRKREGQLWASEGSVQGMGGWVPLNPKYAAWKAANGFGNKILVKAGRLRASMTDPTSSDHIQHKTPTGLEIGTFVPYAIYHQRGTSKMPRRPIVRITDAARKGWVRMIHKFIVDSGQFERKSL